MTYSHLFPQLKGKMALWDGGHGHLTYLMGICEMFDWIIQAPTPAKCETVLGASVSHCLVSFLLFFQVYFSKALGWNGILDSDGPGYNSCKDTVIQWNYIHPIWVKSISVDGKKYLCSLGRWGENILYLFVFFGAINPVEHILYGCIQSRET